MGAQEIAELALKPDPADRFELVDRYCTALTGLIRKLIASGRMKLCDALPHTWREKCRVFLPKKSSACLMRIIFSPEARLE